jgi:hypothetical protein
VFLELYKAAIAGLSSQFEVPAQPGHKPFNMEGEAELVRAKKLATRAWNLTCYATSMWEENQTITSFNEEVG